MKIILLIVACLVVILLMNKFNVPRVLKNIVAVVLGVVVGSNLSEI